MPETEEGQLLELDPKLIEADPANNTRFGLISSRVKELATEITDMGGVMEPIEVAPLIPPSNGHRYRVTFGNYRLAAVTQLNADGAGLTIPAIVRSSSGNEALVRNLTENIGRQQMTPMDEAVAISRLTEAGMGIMEIRSMFSRPGRKGPASPAWLSITQGFLDLPKGIQNKIHNGEIGWDGAAALVRINRSGDRDKMDEILAKLNEQRKEQIAKEEAEEEKFLAALKKEEDANARKAEAEAAAAEKEVEKARKLAEARKAVAKAEKEAEAQVAKAEKELQEATDRVAKDPKAAEEVSKAAKILEAMQKGEERNIAKAQRALDALESKMKDEAKAAKEKAKEKAAEAKEAARLAAEEAKQQKQQKASSKGATKEDVAKAGKAAGADIGPVPLKRGEINAYVDYLCLPGGAAKADVAIVAIGKALKSAFSGVGTEKDLARKIKATLV